MIIPTRFHGSLKVNDQELIAFDAPILGFEDCRRFILLPIRQDNPFLYLQSIDKPELVFVVVDPFVFFATYSLAEEHITGMGPAEEWAVFTICTFYGADRPPSTNLRSPLIINRKTRHGGQFVLTQNYGFEVELPPPNLPSDNNAPVA